MIRKRWVVMRCWASSSGTAVMVPTPTKGRFWTRRAAERRAHNLSIRFGQRGQGNTWFEAKPCAFDAECGDGTFLLDAMKHLDA